MSASVRKSRLLRLKVWGPNACFTRPEMKVERVSYEVMTPSAARGILEAVLWKPEIRWHVEQIDVLKPVRWESVRRNEVGAVASTRCTPIFVEEERQQRAGLFLRDVCYLIHARIALTGDAASDGGILKYQKMFERRASRGQSFHCPYLGCREFPAYFEEVPPGRPLPEPIRESRSLGYMLHDIDYSAPAATPRFFSAYLDQGRIRVPPMEWR